LLNNLKYDQQNNGESAQQIVIHSLYRNTEQKVFYIIVINILGYTTKISNNKLLFKKIDKNPFVILQKNEQNMFRLLKIIRNYREEISYIKIKQLITDKMPIKVALLLDTLIYTFSLNYHRKTRL
jgi:hypothetical protein